MGCDIHLFVEKCVDGKWQVVEDPPCGWCHGTGVDHGAQCFSCKGGKRSREPWAFHDRNYQLFAILAAVRNYHGATALFPDRGVPADASDRGVALADEYGEDGHSHTHFTLAELINGLAKLSAIPNGGLVGTIDFAEWKSAGRPRSWCQGVGGGNTKIVDHATMEAVIASGDRTHSYYTRVEWADAPARHAAGLLTVLSAIAAEHGCTPEDLRAIVFFDN